MKYIIALQFLSLISGNYINLKASISPTGSAPASRFQATFKIIEELNLADISNQQFFTIVVEAKFFDEGSGTMSEHPCLVTHNGGKFVSLCLSESYLVQVGPKSLWYSEIRIPRYIDVLEAGTTYTIDTEINLSGNKQEYALIQWYIVAALDANTYEFAAYAYTTISLHPQSLVSYSNSKSKVQVRMLYPLPASTTSFELTFPSQFSTSESCSPISNKFISNAVCISKGNILEISRPLSKNIESKENIEFEVSGLSGVSSTSDLYIITAYKNLNEKKRAIETMYYGNPDSMPDFLDSTRRILINSSISILLILLTFLQIVVLIIIL